MRFFKNEPCKTGLRRTEPWVQPEARAEGFVVFLTVFDALVSARVQSLRKNALPHPRSGGQGRRSSSHGSRRGLLLRRPIGLGATRWACCSCAEVRPRHRSSSELLGYLQPFLRRAVIIRYVYLWRTMTVHNLLLLHHLQLLKVPGTEKKRKLLAAMLPQLCSDFFEGLHGAYADGGASPLNRAPCVG